MSIKKACANIIIDSLLAKYKDAECELNFKNNFELLVAVILSAQCTDKRVNKVSQVLFNILKTPQDFKNVDILKLEALIKPCGFYHNKAKNIKKMATDIVDKFNGEVPTTKEELKLLAGVGEKTANVVLSTAYKVPAIAVDTHVFRVSKRLGLSSGKNVKTTQEELEKIIPQDKWSDSHYSMVLFGRYVCKSRNPDCDNCNLGDYCLYKKAKIKLAKN